MTLLRQDDSKVMITNACHVQQPASVRAVCLLS
jgi:hypothetical protein